MPSDDDDNDRADEPAHRSDNERGESGTPHESGFPADVDAASVDADVTIRPGTPEDADACGRICYDAFDTFVSRHGFLTDFESPEAYIDIMSMLLSRSDIYSIVAERDGRIIGSNYLWEDAIIGGVGPITVDPSVQSRGVGRAMMEDVLDRADERGLAGVRLVQVAFNTLSMSLYTKLGFDIREPLVLLQGPVIKEPIPGHDVRPATETDLDACNRLSHLVHGYDRSSELEGAIQRGSATVVEHDGRVTGYATAIAFFSHATAETDEDLKALIGAASAYDGPGFLLPARNGNVFRWCLEHGLRVMQPLNLMSRGLYNEPSGAFLPSITY